MGVTITLAIALWLAGSFVEYKIIKGIPSLQPLFNGLPGMAISVLISVGLGFVIAPAAGAAVALAATIGLATNEFTYNFYDRMSKINSRRKQVTTKVNNFKTEHPTMFTEAVGGIKAGFATIAAVFLAIVWIIGLPVRIASWVRTGYARTRSAFVG